REFFFFSSRRRHTRFSRDWSSDVCSSDLNNLEITNDSDKPGDRRGVEISAENHGLIHHVYLRNLHIHHIKGIIGNGHPEKRTAGIYITTVADDIKPTRYNDILIENCHIHHIQNQGIATSHEKGVFDYPEEIGR